MKVQKGCLILALFLAFLLPVRGETSEKTFDLEPAGADSGGPDGFGYRWISSRDPGGPAYSWIDITSVGVPTNAPDEWNSGLLPILPGPFWFYGNTFTNLAICANGWVSFTEGDSAGWPASLPDPAGRFNLIAPLGMDLDPFTGGDIYYWVDSPNSRTVVEWFATPHYGYPETLYTFELIINCSDSTIVLQYDNASNWIAFPAVVGIQNSDGTIALTVPQDSLADSLALKFYWVPPDSNVGVLSIGYPNDAVLLEPLAPCTVQATVENCGASTVSFDVRCDVDSSGLVVYTNTQLVSSLAADSTAPVRFPDWVPAEFIDYTVQVTTLLSGDKFPFNDRKSRRAKAPGPYYRELRWDDGIMTKRHYYPQYDSVMATEFFPPLYPALLKYVSIYCLSEGDLYWPYPDATHDPIGVGIWFDSDGDTMPDTLVYADTILGDSIPPSWVYGIPVDSVIIYNHHFWVGMNNLEGEGEEALGCDNATAYPLYKWTGSYGGGWYRQAGYAGDHMIRAYVSPAVAHDVGIARIVSPGEWVAPNSWVTPGAMVGNFSTNPETFFAYCLIDSAGGRLYRDSVRVDNLPPFDSIPVSFTEWTPDGLGNIYDITVYTALIGDQNPPNDTLKMSTYTFEETTRIPAGWAFSAPAVDGLIETPEWQSAFKVDMSNIYGKYGTAPFPVGSVYAYAMNDSDYLYLAFDCISDNAYQATDNPGIFLDDSHNHQWPAYPDTTEGLNTWQPGIRWASLWFCQGDTGTWRYPRPFPMEVSISSGRMQFEGAIPLGNSVDPAYLDAALGDSAGVFLKYWDEIEGHQGWWPQGSDSIKPLQFGDLILAICPGVLEQAKSQLPMTKSQLLQNCPNPFTHATTITYSLASAVGGLRRAQSSRQRTAVSLRVYDLCGRLVWTLVDGEQEPGFYKVRWDGRSLSGRRAAPGMYFYRIRAGDFESTRKMVLVK